LGAIAQGRDAEGVEAATYGVESRRRRSEGWVCMGRPGKMLIFLCRNNAFWCTFDIGIRVISYAILCPLLTRLIQIAVVASDITNTIVKRPL